MATESAHGKLSPVDEKYTGPRLLGLAALTLAIALFVIYAASSAKTGDWVWHGFLSHDVRKHTFESSTMHTGRP